VISNLVGFFQAERVDRPFTPASCHIQIPRLSE
jgi:hypothetical protein